MSSSLQVEWQAFINKLQKDRNPLYELLIGSGLNEDKNNTLKICLPTEERKNQVKAKLPKIKAKMPLNWQKKQINLDVGQVIEEQVQPTRRVINVVPQASSPSPISRQINPQSPLQSLHFANFESDRRGNELAQPVLQAAASADNTCTTIYKSLTEKTQKLAGENTIKVKFSWRLRVGGMRGFRELLLPVFHPVYGVPYIPSSSLKGAILAAATQLKLDTKKEIDRILGTLNSGIGSVQILDAFPTAPCLNVDMANPQWHWQENIVKYNPEPHALLSMKEPEILIGLIPTSRISNRDNAQSDVNKVRIWLEKALTMGIGSRVSAGYGRINLSTNLYNDLPYSSSHNFQLWTQGMYGADTQQAEFRPVALRGMLRYWFRSFALGIYPPNQCKELEAILFGTIEPKSKEGTIRIAVELEKDRKSDLAYFYQGKILLEAKNPEHLTLIEKILQLSSHLAGIGRGSRRPLHWNEPRMRGCHLQLTNFILPGNKADWKDFFKQVNNAFLAVQRSQGTRVLTDPSNPRSQDILNSNAEIYLIANKDLKHPQDVQNWKIEGITPEVRGKGLQFLYNPKFKGVNRSNQGNPQVGGELGVPSFILIKSNFPNSGQHYQTVTIFGSNNTERHKFIKALPSQYIRVW